MTKITKTTFKSFLKKHQGNILISCRSSFDGMTDGIECSKDKSFRPAKPCTYKSDENTFGINGIWLVNGGRDYYRSYEKDGITGIEVSNCCGHFIIGVSA